MLHAFSAYVLQAFRAIHKEGVAGWARSRPTGNTLFSSFFGRGGEEEKDFCKTLLQALYLLARITNMEYDVSRRRAHNPTRRSSLPTTKLILRHSL